MLNINIPTGWKEIRPQCQCTVKLSKPKITHIQSVKSSNLILLNLVNDCCVFLSGFVAAPLLNVRFLGERLVADNVDSDDDDDDNDDNVTWPLRSAAPRTSKS